MLQLEEVDLQLCGFLEALSHVLLEALSHVLVEALSHVLVEAL